MIVCLLIPYSTFCAWRISSLQRLSAKELLRHRFIKAAKKNAILTELIEKHARWKADGGDENDSSDDDER